MDKIKKTNMNKIKKTNMNKNKFKWFLPLVLLIPISFVTSCGSSTITSNLVTKKELDFGRKQEADYWFVTDQGDVFDKSFNHSGASAVYNFARNYGATYGYTETAKFKDLGGKPKAYEAAVKAKSKLIVGTGFRHSDASKFFTNPSTNPDGTKFVAIDAVFHKLGKAEEANTANANRLTSIIYNSQYAGFLAGLYAIKHLEANQDKYDHDMVEGVKTFKVAGYGGKAYPSVTSFLDGFEDSIILFGSKNKHGKTGKKLIPAADAAADNLGTIDVKMIYAEGTAPSAKDFSNGFEVSGQSADKARTISRILLRKGADIIFPVAGPQIQLTIQEINKLSNNKAKVIGVDQNQYNVLSGSYKDKLIGSAVKLIKQDIMNVLVSYYHYTALPADKSSLSELQTHYKNMWEDFYEGKTFIGQIGFVENTGATFKPNDSKSVADIESEYYNNSSLDSTSKGILEDKRFVTGTDGPWARNTGSAIDITPTEN